MTQAITKNTLTEVTLWANATTTWVVNGNNTVSNIYYTAANGLTQNVESATIRKVIVMAPNNTCSWTITRNGVVVFSSYGAFEVDFNEEGMPNYEGGNAQSNIVATMTGGGQILIDVAKISGPTS